MARIFTLEAFKGFDRLVRVRVIANPSDWGGGSSAAIKITGNLTPEIALEFAELLKVAALEVAAHTAKKYAEEARRRERIAKLPKISRRRETPGG